MSGGGCANGIVTVRVDNGSRQPSNRVGPSGTWSQAIPFPAPPGRHRLTFDCSDYSTAGSPTTMLGSGTLRFVYEPLYVTTESSEPA